MAACVGMLEGCGVSTLPLTVQVREVGGGTPVVGAGVEVDSMAMGPSLKFGDVVDELLGKRGAVVERGLTDERGEARLRYVPGRTVRVMVLEAGAAPAFVLMERDLAGADTEWRALEGARLEVKARGGE